MNNKETLYTEAKDILTKSGYSVKIQEALETFTALGDYEDSAALAERCREILKYNVGNIVEFGSYKGKPIRWIVLEEFSKHRFLLAEHTVDNVPFHHMRDYTHWGNCDLRHWLNKDFIEEAFTLKDRMNILLTRTPNADERWSVENGPETRDKVFVFNLAEFNKYVADKDFKATGDWWWLRGHGDGLLSIQAVYTDGVPYIIGVNKNSTDVGVRPAMWIKL